MVLSFYLQRCRAIAQHAHQLRPCCSLALRARPRSNHFTVEQSAPAILSAYLCGTQRRGALTAAARAAASATVSDQQLDEDREPLNQSQRGLPDLPPPTHTRVKTAEYISSSVKLSQCPKASWPEFAVIGRSNVGKSSLINMLTNKKSLALVSKTPGKTRCINHFAINNSWYMVDLPGYGYATIGKAKRLEWFEFTKEYFLERETLVLVLLLVDASVPVQPADLECASWLADSKVPFCVVFTKVDKRKKKCPSAAENMAAFQKALLESYEQLPVCIQTSAEKDIGRQEVLVHIAQLRQQFTLQDKL